MIKLILFLVLLLPLVGCDDGVDPSMRDFYEVTRLNTMSADDRLDEQAEKFWTIIGVMTFLFLATLYFTGKD